MGRRGGHISYRSVHLLWSSKKKKKKKKKFRTSYKIKQRLKKEKKIKVSS